MIGGEPLRWLRGQNYVYEYRCIKRGGHAFYRMSYKWKHLDYYICKKKLSKSMGYDVLTQLIQNVKQEDDYCVAPGVKLVKYPSWRHGVAFEVIAHHKREMSWIMDQILQDRDVWKPQKHLDGFRSEIKNAIRRSKNANYQPV